MTDRPTKPNVEERRRRLEDIASDLYSVGRIIDEIEGTIIEQEGVVTDEQEAEYDKALDAAIILEVEASRKLDGYGFVQAQLLADADAAEASVSHFRDIVERADRLATAKRRTAESMKRRVEAFMLLNGIDAIDGDVYRFAFQANGGALPLIVDEVGPDDVPEEFRKTVVDFELAKQKLEEQARADRLWLSERVAALRDEGLKKKDAEAKAKAELAEAVAEREEPVPFVRFGERGRHLRIRTQQK